jgi:uncharacterized membrane protein required for colicin V production
MTWFDLLIVAVILASTAFAVVRGALREVGTLVALGLSGAVGYLLLKPAQALFGLSESFLTTLAFGGALAFLSFVALYALLHIVLKHASLSGRAVQMDRIGGGVFGFARGLALIGLGFLAYSYYLDEARRPAAVNEALTLPIAKGAAAFFEGLAPSNAGDLNGAKPKAAEDNAAADGYKRADRAALSEIVTTSTTGGTRPEILKTPAAPRDGDAIAAALKELDPE